MFHKSYKTTIAEYIKQITPSNLVKDFLPIYVVSAELPEIKPEPQLEEYELCSMSLNVKPNDLCAELKEWLSVIHEYSVTDDVLLGSYLAAQFLHLGDRVFLFNGTFDLLKGIQFNIKKFIPYNCASDGNVKSITGDVSILNLNVIKSIKIKFTNEPIALYISNVYPRSKRYLYCAVLLSLSCFSNIPSCIRLPSIQCINEYTIEFILLMNAIFKHVVLFKAPWGNNPNYLFLSEPVHASKWYLAIYKYIKLDTQRHFIMAQYIMDNPLVHDFVHYIEYILQMKQSRTTSELMGIWADNILVD